MRITDAIKAITVPEQLFEQADEQQQAVWLAGFESMRNAVLFLINEHIKPKPSWTFTAVDVKQLAKLSGDSGRESRTQPVP